MDIKFENPQMDRLAEALINRESCWLIIDPPPYAKYRVQEITQAAAGVKDSGAFADRRNMKLQKLAEVMRKREFKCFRVVLGQKQPQVKFGEIRVHIYNE